MAVQFMPNPLADAFNEAFNGSYRQGANSYDEDRRFKLQKAAARAEFDYELNARNTAKNATDVAKQVRDLEGFKQVYPEYADLAGKLGRPLKFEEINDLRETAKSDKKVRDAADAHDKLAAFVGAKGDQDAKDYFAATGKLHPKLTSVVDHSGDAKKKELADLQQQSAVYQKDMEYAAQRKKAASYDPNAESRDIAAASAAGKYKGYQSPYRRSDTVGDARAGSEKDYWNAVNDMMSVKSRMDATNKQRLALTGGESVAPSTAGQFSPPPPNISGPVITGQGGAPVPTSTAPGQQPMPQAAAVTVEQAKNHLLYSAARLKVSPAQIAAMRPPTVSEAAAVKAAVMRSFTDPTAQRQAFYDQLVNAGIDPTKLPIPDQQPAPGVTPGQTQ